MRGLVGRRGLALMVTVGLLGQQGEDVFGRVRRVLGEGAVTELREKQFGRVVQELRAAPAQDGEIVALRGAVEFLGHDVEGAVRDFSKASGLAPLKDGDRFTFAMALVAVHEDTRARSLIQELANKEPAQFLYVYWLGRIDYDLRRYEESERELRRAVELDPNAARAWDSLGLSLDMEGRMEEARRAFEKAVELNRGVAHPSAWPPHNLGYLLLRAREMREAEKVLRESLGYDNGLAQTHYYLGRVLEKEGDEQGAVGEYEAAVKGDTVSAEACYSLGLVYRKLHKNSEAEQMFAEYRRRKALTK